MTAANPTPGSPRFRWACFSLAVVFAAVLLWLIQDLKRDVTQSLAAAQQAVTEANTAVSTVNGQLPAIVAEVKKGTGTLSDLAEDVELIKSVVGIESSAESRGLRGLAIYADEIQRALALATKDQEAAILIEKVIGTDLKVVETAEEFLVGLSKEMVAILLLAKSKQEILWRSCHTGPPLRKPYYIQLQDAEPQLLEEFLRQVHAPSAELPAFK